MHSQPAVLVLQLLGCDFNDFVIHAILLAPMLFVDTQTHFRGAISWDSQPTLWAESPGLGVKMLSELVPGMCL